MEVGMSSKNKSPEKIIHKVTIELFLKKGDKKEQEIGIRINVKQLKNKNYGKYMVCVYFTGRSKRN
jgi:hypothetical protein